MSSLAERAGRAHLALRASAPNLSVLGPHNTSPRSHPPSYESPAASGLSKLSACGAKGWNDLLASWPCCSPCTPRAAPRACRVTSWEARLATCVHGPLPAAGRQPCFLFGEGRQMINSNTAKATDDMQRFRLLAHSPQAGYP